MIYLASSSKTRAQILTAHGIEFTQLNVKYDESAIKKIDPHLYSYNVVNSKKEQFFKIYKDYDRVLFADSSVICHGQILGKAKDDDEAKWMLNLQSGSKTSVVTAMIFVSKEMILSNISIATYKFLKFGDEDMSRYIASKDYAGKAGAMMIEGFNQKYIASQNGNKSTAMGLNVEILKRYING